MFTGLLLSLALRYPGAANIVSKVFGFIKRHWKIVAGVILVIGAWWWFTSWRDNLVEAADAAGYSRAEIEYTAAINAANERELRTQSTLDKLAVAFGGLATQREQEINLTVRPRIERIINEVSVDPRYRECAVSDGVLIDLNAGRAAVDQSIAASNPSAD